jgi:hypothetical protein
VLFSLTEDDPESVARRAAFEQALKELGWTSGAPRCSACWAEWTNKLIDRRCFDDLVRCRPLYRCKRITEHRDLW